MHNLVDTINKYFNIFDFFDSLDDFIHIMTPDLHVVWANKYAKSYMAGYYTGINLFDWLTFLKPNQEKVTKEYQSVIENKQHIITTENTSVKAVPISSKTIKMPLIENGKIDYIVTIVQDQSELGNTILKLEQTVDDLALSNRMLEDFAHICSHDLREPLRSIINVFEMLLTCNEPCVNEKKDLVERAYSSSKRMRKMLQDILLVSTLNKHSSNIAKEKIYTKKVILDIIEDLSYKINESNANIIIAEDLNDVYGDEQLIRQIFLNLIHNSIKYSSEEPPVINISSVDNGDRVLYIISDNSRGMTKEEIDKVFHQHSEWDSPSKVESGMGITIVRRAVTLHGGSIYAKVNPTKGITVYFAIPNPSR